MNKNLYHQITQSPVIPVLTVNQVDDALKLAEIFLKHGIINLEITLRTGRALDCIRAISSRFPEINVGAGTVIHPKQFKLIRKAGAKFAISPGLSESIAIKAKKQKLPFLPGVSSPSEIMVAMEYGFTHLKFFHAKHYGGVSMLEAFAALFPKIEFCPTGGIAESDFMDFLKQSNVFCVGGSWLVEKGKIDFQKTEQKAALVMKKLKESGLRNH